MIPSSPASDLISRLFLPSLRASEHLNQHFSARQLISTSSLILNDQTLLLLLNTGLVRFLSRCVRRVSSEVDGSSVFCVYKYTWFFYGTWGLRRRGAVCVPAGPWPIKPCRLDEPRWHIFMHPVQTFFICSLEIKKNYKMDNKIINRTTRTVPLKNKTNGDKRIPSPHRVLLLSWTPLVRQVRP